MTTPPARARRRRLLMKAVLAFLGTVLAIEIILRGIGCYYRSRFIRAAGAVSDGEVAVLVLGESTTAGLGVPVEDAYPAQLERRLRSHYGTQRIRVCVPPHLGQNTSQMVHRMPQHLEMYRPALVLIMAGANNTWSLAESNLGDFMPDGDWRTRLFRLRRWTDDVKVIRMARLLTTGSGEAWRRMRGGLEGEPFLVRWPPKDDPLVNGIGPEPFLRLWRSDIEGMIRESRAAGAGVILMTYPRYKTPPVAEFVSMSRKWSLPLVENHRAFRALVDQGRGREVLLEDLHHPNAAGYSIVADLAFRAVEETGIIADRLR